MNDKPTPPLVFANHVLKQMIERRYSFERVGYSYRATELEAAIALSELERREENIGRRRFAAAHLKNLLSNLQHI